jgi:murein DD-endopeptidase MepM/ murein hydrolase activator NlpD
VRIMRGVAVFSVALVLSACGGSLSEGPTPTPTLAPAAVQPAPAVQPVAFAMALPWPTRDDAGKRIEHSWTGGPHGWDASCAASFCIGTPVPDKPLRSGLDFGGAGWEVHPVAAGTVIFADEIPGGFGYGVIVDHGSNTDHNDGDLQTWYGHMKEGSLHGLGPVTRDDILGVTSCTGTGGTEGGCGTGPHLHLDLRSGSSKDDANGAFHAGSVLPWDGRTIGGWTITADDLNYNGTATASACGMPSDADAKARPSIYDASTCAGTAVVPPVVPAVVPTPTPTPTPTPRPSPPPQPTGTTWTFLGSTDRGEAGSTLHFRATWKEPKGATTKILIYGLVPCLRYAEKNDRGPCLVKGMALDMSDVDLLLTVPANKRTAKIDVERPWEAGPEPYESYLIRAVDGAGKSKFTILEPGRVCWQCAPGNNLP